MNKNKIIAGVPLLVIPFVLAFILGYSLNIVKLVVDTDFASPYKAEALRILGVVTPLGVITGYMKIEDK